MKKFIIKVRIEQEGVNFTDQEVVSIYDQTAEEVAVWILQKKPFSNIVVQSSYYRPTQAERAKAEEAKAFAEKEGS